MNRTAVVLTAVIVGATGVATQAGAARRPVLPLPVSVTASPGKVDVVRRALGASALRVVRRHGRDFQVVASQSRIAALRTLPGVAAAFVAPSSFSDADPEDPGAAVPGAPKGTPIISEGVERVGADSLRQLANNGAGVTIAVVDLGFGGPHLPVAQAAGELPAGGQLETRSFDPAYGLAGRNAYGNLTNHGDLVAQTVFDYAPTAHYIFVNYHTEQDFQAATEWLIERRPDVVVHSNSFIEGPFDGTSDAAHAVDRVAASGITWVNSAGNYAEKHWQGEWVDADRDDVLDWSAPDWTFESAANSPITFALSWSQDLGSEISDVDLVLEHLEGTAWGEVAVSRDNQRAGAGSAERITNYLSATGGTFRLRAVLASGPPPGGDLTLFSREVTLEALGDPAPGSMPTPGDAEGAIAVGAVDWRWDVLKTYSSQGPTDDGRTKPDVVAPTGTRVSTATGPKAVGGTSNAAPNAAGALALLIGSRRAAGVPVDSAGAKALLMGDAIDVSPAGPDNRFGAGRVRVDLDPPAVAFTASTGAALRKRFATAPLRVEAFGQDASRQAKWQVLLDGTLVTQRQGETNPSVMLSRARLPDGPHTIEVRVTDVVGNVGIASRAVSVDTRPPRVRGVRLQRRATGTATDIAQGAQLVADVRDYGMVRVDLTISRLARVIRRSMRVRATGLVALPLGRLAAGRYAVSLDVTDAAGHVAQLRRVLAIRN